MPTETVLSDEDLWAYFEQVRTKIRSYLDTLTDSELLLAPPAETHTRFELILAQLRHFNVHIGILNGITIAATDRYPYVYGLSSWEDGALGDKLYDE